MNWAEFVMSSGIIPAFAASFASCGHSHVLHPSSPANVKTDIAHMLPRTLSDSIGDTTSSYDPITDWVIPPGTVIERARRERLDPLRFLTSPVFFSTDSSGKRHRGLAFLPTKDESPLLFVSNHQLGGIDIWMLWPELFDERNIVARGLGHNAIFGTSDNNFVYRGGGPTSALNHDDRLEFSLGGKSDGLFQAFGAVEVTPRNFYRLMETGQTALHFPGGAREAFCGQKEEAYSLSLWPDQQDFVRTVAKFNGTIVPISCVGALESADLLVSSTDVVKLPGVGKWIIDGPFTLHEGGEIVAPPIAIPRLFPARHYYLFGRPINTAEINYRDREACQQVYKRIKEEMKSGFQRLHRARKHDPFRNTVRRMIYEQGFQKQAPTFPLEELNSIQPESSLERLPHRCLSGGCFRKGLQDWVE